MPSFRGTAVLAIIFVLVSLAGVAVADRWRGRGGGDRSQAVRCYTVVVPGDRGCNVYGCWTNNGGCNVYGCWEGRSGECNVYGCSDVGSCNVYGCPSGSAEVETRQVCERVRPRARPQKTCNVYGCYAAGGGCNVYGCYGPGGSCNVYGCSDAGTCNVYGCP